MAGNQVAYGAKIRNRPQCRATTPLWAPGADSGQRKKKRNRGQNSDQKMTAVRDPGVAGRWPYRVKVVFLVDYTGHSSSVLRDSAVYSRK